MFLSSLSDLATQFCTQREGAIFLDEPFILRGNAAKTSLTSELGFTQSPWPMWQMSMMPAATQSVFSRWKTQHKALVFRQIPETTLVVQWGFAVDRSAFYGTAATMNGVPFSRCSFVLQPGAEKSVKDIEDHARQVTITRGLVMSPNQDIQLLLEGTGICSPLGALSGHIGPPMQGLTGKPMARPMSAVYNFSNGWKHCSQAAKKVRRA